MSDIMCEICAYLDKKGIFFGGQSGMDQFPFNDMLYVPNGMRIYVDAHKNVFVLTPARKWIKNPKKKTILKLALLGNQYWSTEDSRCR